MSMMQSINAGAYYTGTNEIIRGQVNTRMQEMMPDNPAVSADESTSTREKLLAFAQSDALNYTLTGASAALAAAQGALGAASAAGGMCCVSTGALVSGALTALGTFFAAGIAGAASFAIASTVAEKATDLVMQHIFGWTPVPTSGDKPICMGDDVYHQNKSAAFWGILGGIVLGAAVAAFCVVTFGTGAIVTALIAGAVAGVCTGVGSALSKYGEKKGTVIEGSPNVFFEGKPVARFSDRIACEEHPGEHRIAEGAKTVFANGWPIARLGHQTTCDGNVVGGCATIQETEETSTTYRLPIESSVPLWLRELTTYTQLGMTLFGLAKQAKGVAQARRTVGEPVDIASGDFSQCWSVLSFEGVLPLQLERYYYSTRESEGYFGQKWSDSWSQRIEVDKSKGELIYWNERGYAYHYPLSAEGGVYAQNQYLKECILFGHDVETIYLFNRRTHQTFYFSSLPEGQAHVRYLVAIRDRFSNQIAFHYDSQGLREVSHSDGYVLRVSSENWRIQHIDYVSGQTQKRLVSCAYQDHAYLIDCDSFQFGHLFHRYDGSGYMTAWGDTLSTRAYITYDKQGRVLSTRTAEGHYADNFIYDDAARCTTYIDAEGGKSRYWYNKDYLVIKVEDALGRITETRWDYDQKVAEKDALGRETVYRYNPYGELEEVRFFDGERFCYEYGALGVLQSVTNPRGERWHYEYDERCALKQVTSPQGLVWRYRYDEKGRLIRRQFPDETYQLYEYDKDTQQLCAYRNVKGDKTQLQRDPFGRVTEMILPDKSQYHYEHSQAHANPAGSVTKIRTPEGSELHFRYNSERLLTESVNGNGYVTRYDYGAFDLLQRQTLPNGETLEFHYDKLTRLTEVKNAQGDRYCYVYDSAGQLIKETDFTGRSRGYHYDIAGRLIRTTHADGSVVTFHYNQADQLTCRQVWQPQVSRKAAGQSSGESNVDSTDKVAAGLADSQSHYQLAHQIRYEYDKQSRQLVLSTNTQYHPFYAEHCTEFEYDAQHRLIAEIQDGERVEATLDRYGRQTTLTLPYWNAVEDKADTLAVHQTYNCYGELTDFQINGHQPLQFRYDKLGRQVCRQSAQGFILAEQFSPSGLLQAQGGGFQQVLTAPSLDEHASLPSLHPNADFAQVNQPGLVGTQLSRQWQYDKAFNLTRIQDNHWGNTTYHSNKNGQITAVFNDVRDSEHYRYDSQLNLIEKSKQETNAYGEYLPPAANDSRYHIKQRQGRITRFGNKTYHYDSLGRLSRKVETKKGFRPVTTYYKWNSLHQLVELISPYKGIWRYEYDSLGRRVSKYRIQTEQPTGLSQISLPVRANHRDYWSQIHKLWEAQEQAHITQGQSAQKPTGRQVAYPEQHSTQQGYRYLYHRDQLVAEAPMERGVQGNLALAQSTATERVEWQAAIYWLYQEDEVSPTARYEKGQLHYTVTDQVGTITELMSETGYIDYRQKLSLWGEATIDGHRHPAANDSQALGCHHRFAGQYYDEESELHYNRFRYYSPETGQYLSHDPIGLLGGFNPYGYVFDPTGWVDPLGLAVCPALKAKYDEARAKGMTASEAYAVAKGRAVDISTKGRTDAEIASLQEYVQRSNQWLSENGPQTIVETKGSLRSEASRKARTERRRAEKAGNPYQGQTGHVPDTAVTGLADPPGGWLDMAGVSNNSAGGVLGSRIGQRIDFYTIDGVKP